MGWLDWLRRAKSSLILKYGDDSEIVDYDKVVITRYGVYVWENGARSGKLYDWRDIKHIEIMVAKVFLRRKYQLENARFVKILRGGGR